MPVRSVPAGGGGVGRECAGARSGAGGGGKGVGMKTTDGKAILSVNHRFGAVFVRLRRKTRLGWVSDVARISPETADEFADAIRDCVRAARKEPKVAALKLR